MRDTYSLLTHIRLSQNESHDSFGWGHCWFLPSGMLHWSSQRLAHGQGSITGNKCKGVLAIFAVSIFIFKVAGQTSGFSLWASFAVSTATEV